MTDLVVSLTGISGAGHWSEQPQRYGIPGGTSSDLSTYVTAHLAGEDLTAKYVLINIGANDIAGTMVQATIQANFLNIIDLIHAKYPSANIYIAKPWRRTFGTNANTFAGYIDNVIGLRPFVQNGPDERTWLENGDDGATYTVDGTHYSDAGEIKNAQLWQSIMGF